MSFLHFQEIVFVRIWEKEPINLGLFLFDMSIDKIMGKIQTTDQEQPLNPKKLERSLIKGVTVGML